jgi:hypothetical protein
MQLQHRREEAGARRVERFLKAADPERANRQRLELRRPAVVSAKLSQEIIVHLERQWPRC